MCQNTGCKTFILSCCRMDQSGQALVGWSIAHKQQLWIYGCFTYIIYTYTFSVPLLYRCSPLLTLIDSICNKHRADNTQRIHRPSYRRPREAEVLHHRYLRPPLICLRAECLEDGAGTHSARVLLLLLLPFWSNLRMGGGMGETEEDREDGGCALLKSRRCGWKKGLIAKDHAIGLSDLAEEIAYRELGRSSSSLLFFLVHFPLRFFISSLRLGSPRCKTR